VSENYDVAVIGGGPGGSTAASVLAASGRRVILFEKEVFPRFHIGESLLPYNMDLFDRLGLTDRLRKTFVEKWGAHLISSTGVVTRYIKFAEGYRPGIRWRFTCCAPSSTRCFCAGRRSSGPRFTRVTRSSRRLTRTATGAF